MSTMKQAKNAIDIPFEYCRYCGRECGSHKSLVAHQVSCPQRHDPIDQDKIDVALASVLSGIPSTDLKSKIRCEMERYGFSWNPKLPDYLWVQRLAWEWALMRSAIQEQTKLLSKIKGEI